jgi:GGDEF domain-containing protein
MGTQGASPFDQMMQMFLEKWGTFIPDKVLAEFNKEALILIAEHNRESDGWKRIFERLHAKLGLDPFTQLPGYLKTLDTLAEILFKPGPNVNAVGVLFVDINNFRLGINKKYGHLQGNVAIQVMAAMIRSITRNRIEKDRPIDYFERLAHEGGEEAGSEPAGGRFGGDEFILVLPLEDMRDFYTVAERDFLAMSDREKQQELGLRFAKRLHVIYKIPHLTCAVGGSACSVPVGTNPIKVAQDLITEANKRMYKSKVSGRLHVGHFNEVNGELKWIRMPGKQTRIA